MRRPLRTLLAALLLFPPRVCGSAEPASDDGSLTAAQGASGGVQRGLDGVVNNLNRGDVGAIYGERSVGDPGVVAIGPGGMRATVNLAADMQLPKDFLRAASVPAPVDAPAPSGGLFSWFSSSPKPPEPKPVPDPSFSRSVPCPDPKDSGCVQVMTLRENTPSGLKQVPITDFVEYGTVKYKGKDDTQIWDKRPWWKFWTDPRQTSPDDVHQGGLGDCSLLASLAAISHKEPEVLRRMIKQKRSTLSVWIQFYDGQPPKRVLVGPVDNQFPVFKAGVKPGGKDMGGQAVFSSPSGQQGALWPLLIEKAYAIKFSGDSYAELNEGVWPHIVMTHLTGKPSRRIALAHDAAAAEPVKLSDLVQWDSNSQPIVMSTKSAPKTGCPPDVAFEDHKLQEVPTDGGPAPNAGLPAPPVGGPAPVPAPAPETTDSVCTDPLYMGAVACRPDSKDPVCKEPGKIVKLAMTHAYWVKNVDEGAQTVTLANPWGSNQPTVTLPWTRLQKSLYYVYVNDKAK